MAKQFLFKQSTLLGRGKPGHKNSVGKHYFRGVHSVPEEHQKDPTFVHFAKHGLITPYEPKAQGELKPAESDAAKQSAAVAKSQLEPDAEIGGDSEAPAEESSEESSDDKPRRRRK